MDSQGQISFEEYPEPVIVDPAVDAPVTKQEITEEIKDQRKASRQQRQKLQDLASNTGVQLFKLTTVWPFHLFPKEVIVDINKVVMIDRQFVGAGAIKSINLTDMADVLVETGLLFGKLTMVDRYFDDNTIEIDYLPKDEAIRAHRIVQGLLIAKRERVDMSKLAPEEILTHIENLGQSHSQL